MTLLLSSADLPALPESIVVDCETTSFDDEQAAFQPFNGHRVVGVAIGTIDGEQQWYMPLRHRGEANFPFAQGVAWLKVQLRDRHIVNHNIKFDGRFLYQDGIELKGTLSDTMVLARLVHNDMPNYKLDTLAKLYCGVSKIDEVSAYCKSIGTKDYGRTPISLMAPYAEHDVRITALLYQTLLKKLPDISKELWRVEQRLTSVILGMELRGIRVDWQRLKQTWVTNLRRIDELNSQVQAMVGREVDPMSNEDLTKLFVEQLGILPQHFSETGKPRWTVTIMQGLDHPVGALLGEMSDKMHFVSSYCEGWWKRKGDDDRLHPDFWQMGTRTGRWASKDPNTQNLPPEVHEFIMAEEGDVLVYWDYSQMEYRIFGHYANSKAILEAYAENPMMDFHGHLAKMLGVDRQFAKSMNFAFLYGMGKKKLLATLANLIALTKDEAMYQSMRRYFHGSAERASDILLTSKLSPSETMVLATKVHDDYHAKFPEIRKFQAQVSGAIKDRGWVKNYFGRRYVFPDGATHRGVNYVIQGSSADMCRFRLVELYDKRPDTKLILQIHDSFTFSVPREQVVDFIRFATPILENSQGLRVPMIVELKVAPKYLSEAQAIKTRISDVDIAEFEQQVLSKLQSEK